VKRWMLDTSACIRAIRLGGGAIVDRMESNPVGSIFLSTIALAELEVGIHSSRDPKRNREALVRFCAPLLIVPFDHEAAVAYGVVRAQLEARGTPSGSLDMLIAAHALAAGLAIVTSNEREFRRVDGLAVENWETSP
jgi:tRNA(fMet)-specific endonuclease VapC